MRDRDKEYNNSKYVIILLLIASVMGVGYLLHGIGVSYLKPNPSEAVAKETVKTKLWKIDTGSATYYCLDGVLYFSIKPNMLSISAKFKPDSTVETCAVD